MDNDIDQFDWIPERLTEVLEDILADATVQTVLLPGGDAVTDGV